MASVNVSTNLSPSILRAIEACAKAKAAAAVREAQAAVTQAEALLTNPLALIAKELAAVKAQAQLLISQQTYEEALAAAEDAAENLAATLPLNVPYKCS